MTVSNLVAFRWIRTTCISMDLEKPTKAKHKSTQRVKVGKWRNNWSFGKIDLRDQIKKVWLNSLAEIHVLISDWAQADRTWQKLPFNPVTIHWWSTFDEGEAKWICSWQWSRFETPWTPAVKVRSNLYIKILRFRWLFSKTTCVGPVLNHVPLWLLVANFMNWILR